MESIRLLIEDLTKRSGFSQADIARLLGVPDKTLNAWLSGRVTCRHEQMLGMALEALSARLEKDGRKFKIGRMIRNAPVIKTKPLRLTAEVSGSGGRRFVAIYLNEGYADYIEEWLNGWYYDIHGEKPTSDHERIGSTPEEALDWWMQKHGLAFAGSVSGCAKRGALDEMRYQEMTNLYVVPVSKAKLDSMPEDVRVFFVQAGRLHNELMWLQKLMLASQQRETTNEILTSMQTYQVLMLTRLLAGKLWEGWDLLSRSYFGAKLSQHYEQRLPAVGQEALARLKSYFGKKALMYDVRNQFAFHYFPERIKAILADLDEPSLKFYLSEQSGNTFFQFSETVVNIAMLDGIEKGDYVAALRKLMDEVTKVARDFVDFCDSWISLVLEDYFPEISSLDKLEKVTLSDLPKVGDLGLSYFMSE